MSTRSDRKQANENPPAERAGDITGRPSTNEATNRDMAAARLAKTCLNTCSFPQPSKRSRTTLIERTSRRQWIKRRDGDKRRKQPERRARYENVYEIEKAAGLANEEEE